MNYSVGELIVEIEILTKASGGRGKPIFNGYKPQFKIEESEMMTSAMLSFSEYESVNPGEIIICSMKLLHPELFEKHIIPNKKFELREGNIIVATGFIKEQK